MEVQVKLVPSGVDEDGEEQFLELDSAILDSLKPMLRQYVEKKVDALTTNDVKAIVRDKVAALAYDAFAVAFQETDHWGKPKGDPQSLPDIVTKQVKEHLEDKVDHRGEANYSGVPRLRWMVHNAIKDTVKDELNTHLAALRKEFTDHLAAKIAKVKVT